MKNRESEEGECSWPLWIIKRNVFSTENVFVEIYKLTDMIFCGIIFYRILLIVLIICVVKKRPWKKTSWKAPHLLDTDGDICHYIRNTVKKCCAPFNIF